MDYLMIFHGKATLEDLMDLNRLGYTFVLCDGWIRKIIAPTGRTYIYG